MHAMSNLLLRGDVDAATRAIFTPDTLSPTEMKTITSRILGPNPNPLAKTIVDIATNPLVIMGLIGGYLLWPAAGAGTLSKVYSSMRAGVPETGLVGRFVGGAFTRLRHLVTPAGESMHGAIADLNQSILGHVTADHAARVAAHGSVTSIRGQRQIAMGLQGWAKHGDKDLVHIFKMADTPVSAGLQGKLVDGAQSGLAKTQNYLKSVWDDLYSNPGLKKKLDAIAKKRGLKIGGERVDYFPHQVKENPLRQAIIRHGAGKPGVGDADDYANTLADSLLRKKGAAVPNPTQLREAEKLGDVVSGFADDVEGAIQVNINEFRGNLADQLRKNGLTRGGIEKSVKSVTKRMDIDNLYVDAAVNQIETSAAGLPGRTLDEAIDWASEMIRRPGTYSLDLDDVLTRYSTQIARTKAWVATPSNMEGKSLGDKIDHLKTYFRNTIGPNGKALMPKDGSVDNYLSKQLIPMNLGQKTPKAMARASGWQAWRQARADALRTPMFKKMIPDKPRRWMIDRLEDLSTLDIDEVGHGINSYLYMSSMGLNLGPVSKNVFQNPLTFTNLPGMGMGAWAKGLSETFKKSMGYIDDVMVKGIKPEKAFANQFGDFIESQGPQAGLIDKLFGGKEIVGSPATGVRKGVEVARDVLMAPFKFSELFVNRMPAFYGARSRALSWGNNAKAANRIASNIVDASHFTGGPMGIPSGIMDTWAPWRQFMQFPMRTMDFMINSASMGKNAAKMDLGTVSKMTAVAAGTYTAGKNLLGVDLGPGLLAGALPVPQYEGSPFYPFPLVSPLIQMAGNVVKGTISGEAKPFQDIAPLLIPGGMAAKRLINTLGPKRADYKNRLEDGRVPVYNDRNGLIGAYSPMQLTLRSMGIMPIEVAAERGAAKWLVTQRDQIREFRQKWLEANIANDPIQADKIQRDFQKQYPEMGPMKFKKSDINSIEQRRDTARIGRIMRGLPKAYKPLFQNIVQEAQLGAFTQTLPKQGLPAGLEALQ